MNIYDLNKVKTKREQSRLESYKKILKKCFHRIKVSSNNGNSICLFEVPVFVFGIPLYNTDACVSYIVYKLKENKFKVAKVSPNIIYISWEHISKKISKIDNKLLKMYPKQYEKPKKSKLKIVPKPTNFVPQNNFIYNIPNYNRKVSKLL